MTVPVILLDRIGYDFYRDPDGRPFLPPQRFSVRLVTDVARVAEAVGPEIESVVGVRRSSMPGFLDAVRYLHDRDGVRAERLVAVTERLLLPAAHLREELGMAGPTVAQTLLFRDKVRMKEHLRAHGISVPDFAAHDRGTTLALLARHGVLIAKPRYGAGSVDVVVLREPADVDAFEARFPDRLDDYDVERFVTGPLYHVDSVVDRGRVVAATAGHTLNDTTSFLRGEHWIDVNLGPGPVLDTLLDYNARVLATYPWFSGATHHEVFLTEQGPVFCEIAARAGGGGTLAGFRSRTGVSLDEAVVLAQTDGTVPAVPEVRAHLTGFVMIYGGPGRLLAEVSAPAADWVVEAQVHAHAGDLLATPSACDDAVAVISVRGETEESVRARLAAVIAHATPEVDPSCATP